jgi:Alw26I/Eco31I/Esp3I family type II restriction m6 adenine DNA methyltransferase
MAVDESTLVGELKKLVLQYQKLSVEYKKTAAEPKAEEYVLELFEILGWKKLGEEVIPQKKIKTTGSTDRVDYSLKLEGSMKPSIYVEVKKFARDLDNPEWVKQAIDYGKNGGARWVVLTNFHKIRVFNSDFYADMDNAELFEAIDLTEDFSKRMEHLMLLSRECCESNALDDYAKLHKKWRESADMEELLTNTLQKIRKKWIKAIFDQNWRLYDEEKAVAEAIDSSVQLLFDRIIFSRILEDNGVDEDRKLRNEYEKWKTDKRRQFYSEYLVPFFVRMSDIYDSSIFKRNSLESLKIKNEDFVEGLESFYSNEDGLNYHFDAIPTDVLGHVYENYLSYKVKEKGGRIAIEEEMFERKRAGIYFTPEFLVDYLVKNTLGKKLDKCKTPAQALSIKVLDPACGSGTFLIRAYDEFRKWYTNNPSARQTGLNGDSENGLQSFLDSVMENCLYGVDIDPRAGELARLNLFIRAIHNPKMLPKLHIIAANSLVTDPEFDQNGSPDRPFILQRWFPIVYEDGGFDVVVTNPPWEKWKSDSQEFFEPFYPGFKSLPTQQAKQVMRELQAKKPIVKKLWTDYNAHYEALSSLFGDEKNFQFQSGEVEGRKVSGDFDLYKLFTERAYQLLKGDGAVGILIPSGIYTDLGAKGLRKMLFESTKIECLYSFENRKFIFPDIDQRYKFCTLIFKKGSRTISFPAAFFLYGREDLEKAVKKPTILNVKFIKESSPLSWNILEIKTPLDYTILEKMLKYPYLGKEMKDSWNIDMSRGFDMTNDSKLFKPAGVGVPMLEGKNIHQYTHQWKESPKARYSITEADIVANLSKEKIFHNNYWLAYRLIASSTNERTMISSIIPPGYVCGHSVAIIRIPDVKEMCYLCGILNSFVIDYLMRQKVSTNLTMFNIKELPIPRLKEGDVFNLIIKKVVQLVSITNEFSSLKSEIGMVSQITDEQDRQIIKAKIDAIVAKLYGINEEELKHILSQFPLVDNKIKELVLREYSRI